MANLYDFVENAKEILDSQTFSHLQGVGSLRPPSHSKDFELIKLKANGLMSVSSYQGTKKQILGREFAAPIGLGPFPDITKVKLVVDDFDKGSFACKKVADDL